MPKSKQPSTKEYVRALTERVNRLEQAAQMNSMLVQRSGQMMQQDLQELSNRQREIQYNIKAIESLTDVSIEEINKEAKRLQIKDYEELSDKEDKEQNLVPSDVATEDSIVIFTSTTPDEEKDKGYLRSKVRVGDISIPDLKEAFVDKKVGDKFECEIQDANHHIEVLGIRVAGEEPVNLEVNLEETVKEGQ